MNDIANRTDADLKLFHTIWKRLNDHCESLLQNKDDNQFKVRTEIGGKSYLFEMVLSCYVNSYKEPLRKLIVQRSLGKKWMKIQWGEDTWAHPPQKYTSVGSYEPYYHGNYCYMTWEEMFVFIAQRDDILTKLKTEIEARNKKEKEQQTPFQSLASRYNVSLEGIDSWLVTKP